MDSQLHDRWSPCSGLTSSELTFDELWSLSSLDDDDDDGRRMKFEVGCHFDPNNDELIHHFLKKRVLGIDLQKLYRWIAEVDILQYEPSDLPALSAVQSKDLYWYFIYRLVDYGKCKRGGNVRTLRSGKGKWSVTGNTRQVKSETTNQVIGTKKTLVYCPGDPRDSPEAKGKGKRKAKITSEWAMHEYYLPSAFPNPDKYVIVKLIKKGGKLLNLSPANGEAIYFPEEVRESRPGSIAFDLANNAVARSTALSESSQSSLKLNTEPIWNYYDPNQNGFVEQEHSWQPMSSSPFIMEHEASSGYYNSMSDNTIEQWPLTQAGLDEFFDFIELRDPLQSNVGSSPSPQSPKFVEQIQQPSQGCVPIAQVTTVDP